MHFYKSFWNKAVTLINHNLNGTYNATTHTKLAATYATGGLGAAITLYGLLSAITAYCSYCDNKSLYEIIIGSFYNGCSPFQYVINTKNLSFTQKRILLNISLILSLFMVQQIFYGCTPDIRHNDNDGTILWQLYFGISGTPLKAVTLLSILGFWGSVYWIFRKYCDAKVILHTSETTPEE
jgi:hypothetical protein